MSGRVSETTWNDAIRCALNSYINSVIHVCYKMKQDASSASSFYYYYYYAAVIVLRMYHLSCGGGYHSRTFHRVHINALPRSAVIVIVVVVILERNCCCMSAPSD